MKILICYNFAEHYAIDDEKPKEPKEEKCEEKAMADKEKQDKYGNNWPR